jgi:hypothetical protein
MLARNKELISGMHEYQEVLKETLKELNQDIKEVCAEEMASRYIVSLSEQKQCTLHFLQKNSKSLKQLAEIQKEIKIEIKRNDSRDSYLLMLAKRGD